MGKARDRVGIFRPNGEICVRHAHRLENHLVDKRREGLAQLFLRKPRERLESLPGITVAGARCALEYQLTVTTEEPPVGKAGRMGQRDTRGQGRSGADLRR